MIFPTQNGFSNIRILISRNDNNANKTKKADEFHTPDLKKYSISEYSTLTNLKKNDPNDLFDRNEFQINEISNDNLEIKKSNIIKDSYKDSPQSIQLFLNFVFFHLTVNQTIENIKQQLICSPDFTVTISFKIFDQQRNGTVSFYQMQNALNEMQLKVNKMELFRLVSKLTKDKKRRITYSDFYNLIIPINRKVSIHTSNENDIDKVNLSQATILIFKNLLNSILEKERILNNQKKILKNQQCWDKHIVYNLICSSG